MQAVRVSAPGSIMVTGEHAVVYGHPAIVAAIDQRITVQIIRRADRLVTISSEIAPPAQLSLDSLSAEGPYRFVLAAVMKYRADLSGGVDITITSQIDPTLGLGSSAAVVIACLRALAALTDAPLDTLHKQALDIVQSLQGRGSGADLAASLRGGMIAYQLGTEGLAAQITALPVPPPLSLCYVGYKTPTGEVLRQVAEASVGREAAVDALYTAMGETAAQAISSAGAQEWAAFGSALSAYQDHMRRLGVSDDALEALIARAAAKDGVMGAKISGSGLGDCVLALGAVPEGFTLATLAMTGVTLHD